MIPPGSSAQNGMVYEDERSNSSMHEQANAAGCAGAARPACYGMGQGQYFKSEGPCVRAPSCSAGFACAARTRFSTCAKNSAVKAGRLEATMLSHSWLPASRKLRHNRRPSFVRC
jgi:hypothetical protein